MEKYIVFFDIDGTLLTEDTYEVPESTKEALRLARENGHYVMVNTGRTYVAIDHMIKELNFDGYVCGCGTNLYFQGKELLKSELSNQFCKELVEDLYKYKIDGILEGSKNLYYRKERLHKHVNDIFESHQVRDNGDHYVSDWDDENIVFDKLALWYVEDSDFQSFKDKYKDKFDFIHRDVDFYELVPTGFSKATGMEFMINHLNMEHKYTIAIGDSSNDLAMLKYAHTSIAMGNATDKVKEESTFVTTDIHEDGIYNALKKAGLI